MARKRTPATLNVDSAVLEEDDVVDKLQTFSDDPEEAEAEQADGDVDTEDDGRLARGEGVHPNPGDPGFQEYAMSLLEPHEVDHDGNPRYHGLRRLVEELCGPIVGVRVNTIEAPTKLNGFHATVEAELTVRWGGDEIMDLRVFGDVSDCYAGNTDAFYARHAAATAATKAKARACREALKFKGIASEEATSVPVEEAGLENLVTPAQVRAMDKCFRDLQMDGLAYLNSGKRNYPSARSFPYDRFQELMERLDGFLKEPETIPEKFRGYKADWLS